MKSVEFCYWLQGVFEVQNPLYFDAHQVDIIRRHLDLVFKHEIDPSYPNQAQLNFIHNGPGGGAGSPSDFHNTKMRC